MNDNLEVGKKIKMLRKQRGLNQQDLADYFEVTRGSISNWENSKRIPDVRTLEKIANFFNVGVEYFISSKTKDDVKDLLVRAEEIFLNDSLSKEDKIKLYNQIMKIYLNSQG